MHNYYAQPIYYTYVIKCCESLTDWSIPLTYLSHRPWLQSVGIIPVSALSYVHIKTLNKSINVGVTLHNVILVSLAEQRCGFRCPLRYGDTIKQIIQ